MTLNIQKHSIEEIIAFFVAGFDTGKDTKIVKHEFNYDPRKGEVLITLFVEGAKPESKS